MQPNIHIFVKSSYNKIVGMLRKDQYDRKINLEHNWDKSIHNHYSNTIVHAFNFGCMSQTR